MRKLRRKAGQHHGKDSVAGEIADVHGFSVKDMPSKQRTPSRIGTNTCRRGHLGSCAACRRLWSGGVSVVFGRGTQDATEPAAADQVHDRCPLPGSFFGGFTVFSHRRISRSSQPNRSVTSWRNCEFSSSSSAIFSRSLSVRSAISLCSFPCVGAIATPFLVHLFLREQVPDSRLG
jgi:hypothetical protein